MEVTILVDTNVLSDRYLVVEHGFFALIESHGCQVIFDTGYSGAVITNAENLGINSFIPINLHLPKND